MIGTVPGNKYLPEKLDSYDCFRPNLGHRKQFQYSDYSLVQGSDSQI